MKIQLETSEQNLISHYGPGSISINGTAYTDNILITANAIVAGWFTGNCADLSVEHFAPLWGSDMVGDAPEIVLLGTGNQHTFPDMSLLVELRKRNLAVEVMNTRAACRTYSVLIGEHRPVAAALLQIEH